MAFAAKKALLWIKRLKCNLLFEDKKMPGRFDLSIEYDEEILTNTTESVDNVVSLYLSPLDTAIFLCNVCTHTHIYSPVD